MKTNKDFIDIANELNEAMFEVVNAGQGHLDELGKRDIKGVNKLVIKPHKDDRF